MAHGGPAPSTSTALVPLGHVSDDITNDILAGMKRKLDQVGGYYSKDPNSKSLKVTLKAPSDNHKVRRRFI